MLSIADVSDGDTNIYTVVLSNSYRDGDERAGHSDGERRGAIGGVAVYHDELGWTTGAVAVAGDQCNAASGLEHQWRED